MKMELDCWLYLRLGLEFEMHMKMPSEFYSACLLEGKLSVG